MLHRFVRRCLHSSSACIPALITTPIFYVNAAPHIGHLHSAILADAICKWMKTSGQYQPRFTSGTDEHGLKIQQAALSKGIEPKQFCDQISADFSSSFKKAELQFDDFIRTTEPRHKVVVDMIWDKLVKSGYVYWGEHEGWYCTLDETFVPESEVKMVDGQRVSAESGRPVEWVKESNYLFRLSALQDQILKWIQSEPCPITPIARKNEVEAWVSAGLQDISISRPRSRLTWGIQTPSNPDQTIYVWVDALTNYLTVCGFPFENKCDEQRWKNTIHIVGKDILRFHAVYWPAFLIAAGICPPKQVVAHAHWTVNNVKMSKSLGNVVGASIAVEKFGIEPLRYYMLREGKLADDADFSEDHLWSRYDSELCDTWGNLFTRCVAPKLWGEDTKLPLPCSEDSNPRNDQVLEQCKALMIEAAAAFDKHEFNKGIESILATLHIGNRFFSECEPWKSKNDKKQLCSNLRVVLDILKGCSILLQPVLPCSSTKLLCEMGVDPQKRNFENAIEFGSTEYNLGSKLILFRKSRDLKK